MLARFVLCIKLWKKEVYELLSREQKEKQRAFSPIKTCVKLMMGIILLAVAYAIIAAAGKAAHLTGVLAAHTTLPVIGIPIKSSTLDGLDALLATVQMPSGIPVATVAIDGAENAAILAVQMLSLSEPALAEKLDAMKRSMEEKVLAKDAALAEKLA